VNWIEYQCRTDLINFFNTQPSKLMGVSEPAKPEVHNIRIKHMVSEKTYKRIKRNFFRVHYQFVFGNTKHYHYDFPDICFGTTRLTAREVPAIAASKVNRD
jgi:ABC-type long-subunit fatty acid transport system fused permease/ATPase subunit